MKKKLARKLCMARETIQRLELSVLRGGQAALEGEPDTEFSKCWDGCPRPQQ
jgi:hypothetical protein